MIRVIRESPEGRAVFSGLPAMVSRWIGDRSGMRDALVVGILLALFVLTGSSLLER